MTQARFEEALYQAPVTDKALHPRARITVWIPIVLVVCGLVFANYQYLKFGPDWAHVVDTGPPDSTWMMYTDPSGTPARVDLVLLDDAPRPRTGAGAEGGPDSPAGADAPRGRRPRRGR